MPRLHLPRGAAPLRRSYRCPKGGWVMGSYWTPGRTGLLHDEQAEHYVSIGVLELVDVGAGLDPTATEIPAPGTPLPGAEPLPPPAPEPIPSASPVVATPPPRQRRRITGSVSRTPD